MREAVENQNVKILVVEDERQLNKMIRDYLESLGWEALAAYNGSEALILFAAEEPDFVLLDIDTRSGWFGCDAANPGEIRDTGDISYGDGRGNRQADRPGTGGR